MRVLRTLLPLLAFSLLALSPTFGQKAAQPTPVANAEFVADELIVKYRNAAPAQARAATQERLQAFQKAEVTDSDMVVLQLPEGLHPAEAARQLRQDPAVEYAEPNYIYHAIFTPNDASFGSQYALQKIGAPAAWDIWQGNVGTIVAILDTGINKSHPDLSGKVVAAEYDFANNDANAQDDHWHGTHCAGIAAANTNNAAGIAGVGFNASLMAVKVLNASGSGTLANIASGIRFAADNGAHVISLSLGGLNGASTLQQAIDYAWGKGVIVVAAAGNNNTSSLFYPGAYANVIAVGATDSADARASFSNFGNWVDVAAPGVSILSVYQNGYAYASGTSMACPHVAGAASLLYSYLSSTRSMANAQAVRSLLEFNGVNVGTWNAFGRINLAASLTVATHPTVEGTYYPTVVTPEVGTVSSGNLASLVYRDNQFYNLRSAPSGAVHVAAYNVTGSVPGTITQLQVYYAGKVDITGVTLTLQSFNVAAGTWETVQTLPAPTTDTLTLFTLNGSLRRFVSAAGEVKLRVQASHPGQPFTFSANLTRWRIYEIDAQHNGSLTQRREDAEKRFTSKPIAL